MKPAKRSGPARATGDAAATYDEFKEFEGRRYTGMRVGRSHHWHYDPGDWRESKVTPDRWTIEFAVTKRRAGKAPEGSGVPIGTSYHWYILAHQNVTKVTANDYTTSMTGMKFKLAHKRADKGTWSAGTQAQRRGMIRILREVIEDLERGADAARSEPAVGRNGARAARPSRKSGAATRRKPGANGRAKVRSARKQKARRAA